MRCPDCCKFVPFDDDASNAEINGEAEVDSETGELDFSSLEVRLPRLCGECSTELAEYTFSDFDCDNETDYENWAENLLLPWKDAQEKVEELEAQFNEASGDAREDLGEELDEARNALSELGDQPTFEIEMGEVDLEDYSQTTDRHGKRIKNFRYQKHMFKVSVTANVNSSDGDSFSLDFTSEAVPASSFDELV